MADSNHNTYALLIREHHLDSYGHVNNATYLELYEESRWEMFTRIGLGYEGLHERGEGFVILEINLTFLAELRLREIITINYELLEFEGKTGVIKQQMHKSDGTVASELLLTFGIFDLNARKLIQPCPFWLAAMHLPEHFDANQFDSSDPLPEM